MRTKLPDKQALQVQHTQLSIGTFSIQQ
uniref:Uncharacterized protein n=1 Tax=Amphimedon queenslandica TaxID=400682 RepID=A0A1X7TFX0_AMPQE